MRQYIIDPELDKCLPPLDDETYKGLKTSLSENGYDAAFPIIIWKGHDIIVDGHHRNKACIELGIEPVTIEREFESLDDAILFALEHQENRRNLLPSQTAIVGTKRLLLKERIEARKRQTEGTLLPAGSKGGESAEVIAKKLHVGKRTIDRVITVINANEPDLEHMLTNGEIKAETGDLFIKNTDPSERSEIIANGPAAIKAHVRGVRVKQKAIEREREVQEEQAKEKAEINEYKEVLKEQFGDSRYSCGLSSVFEMWCNSCKCAFDIFKPMIAKCCPACASDDIEKRDESWYPGKKVD